MSGQAADWQAVAQWLMKLPGATADWASEGIALLGNCDNPFTQNGPAQFNGPFAGNNPLAPFLWRGPSEFDGVMSLNAPTSAAIPDVQAAIDGLLVPTEISTFGARIGILQSQLNPVSTSLVKPIGGTATLTVHDNLLPLDSFYENGAVVVFVQEGANYYVIDRFYKVAKGFVTAAVPYRTQDVGLGAGIGTVEIYQLDTASNPPVETDTGISVNARVWCMLAGTTQIRVDDEVAMMWIGGAWYVIQATNCPQQIP